jgi:hypothetical protein
MIFCYLPKEKIHDFNLEKHTPEKKSPFFLEGERVKKRPINLKVYWADVASSNIKPKNIFMLKKDSNYLYTSTEKISVQYK